MKKRGRPEKPEAQRRTLKVMLRMSDAHYQELAEIAESKGIPVSTFATMIVLDKVAEIVRIRAAFDVAPK